MFKHLFYPSSSDSTDFSCLIVSFHLNTYTMLWVHMEYAQNISHQHIAIILGYHI